jgi:hypothetical protein
MKKPLIVSQLSSQMGMGRPGGAASKGSMPSVMKSSGSAFAAMENTLLKGATPNPKSMAGGGSGRQFYTKAAGGDGVKLPKAIKMKKPKA